MKRWMKYGMTTMAATLILAACGSTDAQSEVPNDTQEDNGKLKVVATLFPQYDFVRQIAGDLVDVTKLLPAGVDVHHYEPTPQDIITLNDADLFIYTGAEMEPWAHRLVETVDHPIRVLDVSQNANLIPWGAHDDHDGHDDHDHDAHDGHDHDAHDDHAHDAHDDHDHDAHDAHDHDAHDHDAHDDHDHDHDHTYDPHIWTSPVNAMNMVETILQALVEMAPEHEEEFRTNAEAYIGELGDLHLAFRDMVATASRDTIYHAGRFAVHYLLAEYGIHFVAAPMETDPSAALIAQMITEIKEQNIPAVFHEELVNPRYADMIASETGAKSLLLHSLHNVSNDELAAGITYLDLMEQNLANLRFALN